MSNLIVYYTRTGTCKKVCEELASQLESCDIDELIDETNYSGFIGWLKAGYRESTKKEAKINYKKNASTYDNVLVITPVWAGGMTPAARQYIKKELNGFKNLYILSVCLGSNSKKVAETVLKSNEIAKGTFCINNKENNKEAVLKEIAELLGK
ncbi:MAG: hypothetical protein JXQ23_13090 [Clostridia bacterium]|nr:hypothetical protein [Clostridia bacterium]